MARAGHADAPVGRGLGMGLASLAAEQHPRGRGLLVDMPIAEVLAAPVAGSSPYYQPDGRKARPQWDLFEEALAGGAARRPAWSPAAQRLPAAPLHSEVPRAPLQPGPAWSLGAPSPPASRVPRAPPLHSEASPLHSEVPRAPPLHSEASPLHSEVPRAPPQPGPAGSRGAPSAPASRPEARAEPEGSGAPERGRAASPPPEEARAEERSGLLDAAGSAGGEGRYPWWDRMRAGLVQRGGCEEERVDRYGAELFQVIDDWLSDYHGQDFKEYVDYAMHVKTHLSVGNAERGCVYWLVTLFTCGLWLLFRRGPATALLVLTKTGRVILVEATPMSVLGAGSAPSRAAILWYVSVLVFLTVLPITILITVSPGTDLFSTLVKLEGAVPDDDDSDAADHSITRKIHHSLRERAFWWFLVVAVFWALFVCWLIRNRQRGYGNRSIREFRAQSVCNAQYALEHGRLRPTSCTRQKTGKIRFYFGKYAGKTEMDEGLPPACPEGSAVVPLARLSDGASSMSLNERQGSEQAGKPSGENGQEARQSRSSGSFLSLVLLFCSSMTQILIVYSVGVEVVNAYRAESFCAQAHEADHCTQAKCEEFAVSERLMSYKFCEAVSWVDEATDHSQELCASAIAGVPCCTNCIPAELFWWLGGDDPGAWAQTASQFLSLLVLLLALAVSRQAAAAEFGAKTCTNCLEVEFVHNFLNPDGDAFFMTEQIATGFLDRVFRIANPAFMAQRVSSKKKSGAPPELTHGGSEEYVPELDHESNNWQEFFYARKRLAEVSGRPFERAFHVPSVPTRCLGMIDPEQDNGEKVVAAWAEVPVVSYTQMAVYLSLSILISCFIVFWPSEHGGSPIKIHECRERDRDTVNKGSVLEEKFMCNAYRFLWVVVLTMLLTPIFSYLRHRVAVALEMVVVVVTTERIYAIYHSWGWGRLCALCLGCCCCDPSMGLRVDVFRHGDGIYYGKMSTKVPLWFDRLFNASFEPGDVIAQSIFGVFKIDRRYGNAESVYNLVVRVLSRDVSDLDIQSDYPGRNFDLKADGPICFGVESLSDGRPHMGIDEKGFWWKPQEKVAPVDGMLNVRDSHIANTYGKMEETPLFVWSFVERGKIMSPFDAYNDILITTDRVRLHSQVYWKFLDCRTCWCWGACWCFCLRRLLWRIAANAQLPKSRSFLNFTHLTSFATETVVTPSRVWLRCPCFISCCAACTACVHCKRSMCPARGECCGCPREEPPKVQLWLLFLQKWSQAVQADMVLSVRPYKLPELEGCDDARQGQKKHADTPEVQELRNLMRAVLRKRDEKDRMLKGELDQPDSDEEEPPPE